MLTVEILNKLSEEQCRAAQALAGRLASEMKVVFKLDASVFTPRCYPNQAHAFAYEEERLAAVATVSNWGQEEPEGTFVCANEHLRALVDEVRAKLPPATKRFFMINDGRNLAASEILKAADFTYAMTERQLVLNAKKFSPVATRDLTMRCAEPSDREAVENFEKETWGETLPVSDEALAETVLGLMEGELVAKLLVDEDTEASVCGLFGFAVKPSLRGKGLGKALLSQTIESLLAKGFRRVYLQVNSNNATAAALYAKLGFEPECELEYYISA